jgi:hypothetical protein
MPPITWPTLGTGIKVEELPESPEEFLSTISVEKEQAC